LGQERREKGRLPTKSRVGEHRNLVGKHRSLVLEKVLAFTGKYVTSRIGTKHAVMHCNPNVYLTEFDDRAELPETVIAPVEGYLLLGWVGARCKP